MQQRGVAANPYALRMSATPAEALDALRALARSGELPTVCFEQGITLLVAFGSVVDPQRRAATSHLDVAALFDPAGLGDDLSAAKALVRLLGVERVEVLDLLRATPAAQEQALIGTVPLYERDPGTLTAIRDRAMAKRIGDDLLGHPDLMETS